MRKVLKLAAERRRRAALEFKRYVENLALRDANLGDIEQKANRRVPTPLQDARPPVTFEELP